MFNPIELSDFEERTGIQRKDFAPVWNKVECVVSLRDFKKVFQIQAMPREYLLRLLKNITLTGDNKEKPFKGCSFELLRSDPNGLLVGQTFVLRKKYQKILEEFPSVFGNFCVTRGIAKLTAQIVLGEDVQGKLAIAHYIPPIIETSKGTHSPILLDGIHRNFLAKNVGTTMETILIRNVKVPFPADPVEWSRITVVDEKPIPDERYFNLRPELFRDLKSIGIDG